ncbi:MAG: hypothetical protein AW10_00142 [Candidatus Accumulibacter appositus]|uniref:Uncharacterized protein n=1 Tax=Candidatus Accumulibacter appositus TaxID=1454003 RepID=A0A011NJG0_9PROT|nr:MAG: hypothetical protein AW10_00142 [Candidatus Accumulibacter appositus]
MFSFVPGAAANTFGKLISTGSAKVATPGAWMVMSKLCCSTPGGNMSRTSSGGTVLMPICTSCSTSPFSPIALPGLTVSVSPARCCSVSCGAEAASVRVITVVAVSLTACRALVGTRGK